tara:strand:+ start:5474 stop:6004 length:531 start_codon:yes stop_codon:yes gene_type:complete
MSFICFWPSSGTASNYMGNVERVRAIEGRPPQVAVWPEIPTIVVCEYAPVTIAQIGSAVKFWEGLGYKFNQTQYKHDPTNKCASKNPVGYIIIHMVTAGVRLDDTSLAQTHFYVDNNTSTIDWAVIYMRADLRSTVLEHELGHALGFLHFNRINHLMNQKWEMGGWDTEGLKNSPR